MKFAKTLSILTVVTLSSVVTSVQAVDLVKVEPIKDITLTQELKLDIEQSLKSMQLNVVPSVQLVKTTAIDGSKMIVKNEGKKLAKLNTIAE
jgi:hypothetical protein